MEERRNHPDLSIRVGVAALAEMLGYARPTADEYNPLRPGDTVPTGRNVPPEKRVALDVIVSMLVGDTEPRHGASKMDHLHGGHSDFVWNVMHKFPDDWVAAEIILDEIQADRKYGVDRPSGRGNIWWARHEDTYVMFGR